MHDDWLPQRVVAQLEEVHQVPSVQGEAGDVSAGLQQRPYCHGPVDYHQHDIDGGDGDHGDHGGDRVGELDYFLMEACTATGCTAKSLRNSQLCMTHLKRKVEIAREIHELAGGGAVDWDNLLKARRDAVEWARQEPRKGRFWGPDPGAPAIHQTAVTKNYGHGWPTSDYQRDSLKDMMKLWEEKMDTYKIKFHSRAHPRRSVDSGYGVAPEWTSGWFYSLKGRMKK